MASVSSLDQDMRNLRMSKYTPQAANECRSWIEGVLGERLPAGDLLQDALKDGVVLCKLVNMAIPSPGVKYKQSGMPFIQMENISNFLRACESPPLNMAAHDRFLTVDLFESKDPAQVLQCITAFSRVANAVQPNKFPNAIGPKRAGALSPANSYSGARSGAMSPAGSTPLKSSSSVRPMSPALTGGSTGSRGPVSSWSNRTDEASTTPAWNIHQYGYMGGASQGNQGVAFGARRQITSAAPQVPSLAEKERRRKEKAAEEERLRVQAEEAEYKRKTEREAEEERDRVAEEEKWEAETRKARDEERRRIEEQKRQWEEQEKRWQVEEEARSKEDAEMQKQASGFTDPGRPQLKGQYLSEYKAEQATSPRIPSEPEDTPEARRVRELEKQLDEARERERQYQIEREERSRQENGRSKTQGQPSEPIPRPPSPKDSEASWAADDREVLQRQSQPSQQPSLPSRDSALGSARPLPSAGVTPSSGGLTGSRPLLQGSRDSSGPVIGASGPRPLPTPSAYKPVQQAAQNRTDRFLVDNAAPVAAKPASYQPAEMGYTSTYEEQADRDRRLAAQQKTKAGGWASKSLLEREMERERERQKEWEASQQETKSAARNLNEGTGEGQSWDVNQYGWTGGDSQNRGSSSGSGIGMGGRRQIIGPRPLP